MSMSLLLKEVPIVMHSILVVAQMVLATLAVKEERWGLFTFCTFFAVWGIATVVYFWRKRKGT